MRVSTKKKGQIYVYSTCRFAFLYVFDILTKPSGMDTSEKVPKTQTRA